THARAGPPAYPARYTVRPAVIRPAHGGSPAPALTAVASRGNRSGLIDAHTGLNRPPARRRQSAQHGAAGQIAGRKIASFHTRSARRRGRSDDSPRPAAGALSPLRARHHTP